MARAPRFGHLAFGVAIAAIAIAWLAGGEGMQAGWLVVVAGVSFGAAALLTAVAAIVRSRA